ncbi:hypothetical protein E4U19_002445 [Claviceps sp. Clav32 group G5]|nr:hypothetical protein E4U19_002445 [Claviceps sp. Clav32 group G5]
MPVHNIQSEQAFHNTISDNDFVIANFFATHDEECKTLAPIFVEQANREDHQGIFFGKVDVHELVDLTQIARGHLQPILHRVLLGSSEQLAEVGRTIVFHIILPLSHTETWDDVSKRTADPDSAANQAASDEAASNNTHHAQAEGDKQQT